MTTQTTLPTELTGPQLCSLLGITLTHVNRLEKLGAVVKTTRGRYATSSVARVFEHMRQRGAGPNAWNAARTRKMEESARLAELTRMEREGELIRSDAALECWSGIASTVRTGFLGLPKKMANQVVRTRDAGEAELLLRKEVNSILAKLAADATPVNGARRRAS
jgi:phage terminase Nu1 subunit (DNA packaging protein)